MTPSNLAIVFGPSMLPQDTTHIPIDQLAIAMERPADIMLCLLNNVTLLFAQVEENIATSKKDIEEDYDYEVVNPAFCLSQIVDQDNQEAELVSFVDLKPN